MNTPDEELYVFLRLADGDVAEAVATIALIASAADEQIRIGLLKSAVVAYCRPFKASRGIQHRKHKLPSRAVPPGMEVLHYELETLRDQAFAHTDLDSLTPQLLRLGHPSGASTLPILRRTPVYPQLLKRLDELDALFAGVMTYILTQEKALESTLPGIQVPMSFLPPPGSTSAMQLGPSQPVGAKPSFVEPTAPMQATTARGSSVPVTLTWRSNGCGVVTVTNRTAEKITQASVLLDMRWWYEDASAFVESPDVPTGFLPQRLTGGSSELTAGTPTDFSFIHTVTPDAARLQLHEVPSGALSHLTVRRQGRWQAKMRVAWKGGAYREFQGVFELNKHGAEPVGDLMDVTVPSQPPTSPPSTPPSSLTFADALRYWGDIQAKFDKLQEKAIAASHRLKDSGTQIHAERPDDPDDPSARWTLGSSDPTCLREAELLCGLAGALLVRTGVQPGQSHPPSDDVNRWLSFLFEIGEARVPEKRTQVTSSYQGVYRALSYDQIDNVATASSRACLECQRRLSSDTIVSATTGM